MSKKKKRVIIAMSGGVDSSVAAAILKKQVPMRSIEDPRQEVGSYDVVGIFMRLWAENIDRTDLVRENICCSVEAATAARAVCNKLKIPFYVINLEKEFKKAVVDYYIKEYEEGRTPNPCVICNRDIKGEILMRKVSELKADYLATGHYARIREVKSNIEKGKSEYQLLTSIDQNKDQTYFLWTLAQKQLAKLLFPIGDMIKPDVRRMAKKLGLPTAERKESQGICFIPDRDVCGFLHRHGKKLTQPGPILDIDGKKIGQHNGLIDYTIGQRERLGIGGPKAYYVVKLDVANNILIVGDEKDLYQKELIASDLNWIGLNDIEHYELNKLGARIRYGHEINECKIKRINKDKIKVIFDQPQRAITPGQSIVFYNKEEVLGGGIIQ